MSQGEFLVLDFYGKLEYMIGICGEAHRGLKRIVNVDAAWAYIEEVLDQLEQSFSLFKVDEDFLDSDNFSASYRYFRINIEEVLEIIPLIRKNEAHYSYLVTMLEALIGIIEENFPRDVKLARTFKSMIANKSLLAKVIGAEEREVEDILNKMLLHVDEVEDIIKNRDGMKKLYR